MQKLVHYIYACCCILFLSCNDDKSGQAQSGTLYLNVNQDKTVLTKAQSVVAFESLRVDVIAASGDTVKSYDDYVKEVLNEKLILPVGTYTVAVVSNQSEVVGWETPLYAGKETVEVKAGEITSATVVCKIANTKVTVIHTDGVKENFVNYETTVSNSSGSLLYTRDEYRAGYFTPEKLTASLALTNNDGKEFTISRVFTDIKPRYHYTIKFKIGDKPNKPEGGSDFNITVDDEAKVVECEVVIDEDDMEGKKVPVIKLSDSFKDNLLSVKVGEDLPSSSLQIISQVGIESLVVKVKSDLFTSVGLESFDLTNLDDMTKNRLEEFGFPLLSENQDVNDITLNFDALVGKFLQDIAYQQSKKQHEFTVYAMDALHQETEIKFIIEAKPDVAIYVEEPNCWSTFAVLKGFCADKSYFKLEKVGGGVTDIKIVTHDSDGNIAALVIGLKSGVSYKYWLVSEENPDMVCEPKEFTLNTPFDIPNIGFDNWTDKTTGYLDAPLVGGTKTYISPNADPNAIYWESGNLGAIAGDKVLTAQTEIIALSSSVNTKAARLKSTWAGKTGFGAFAAGSIYSGQPKEVSASGAILEYGRTYQGFPTYLEGYYKYNPGIMDYVDKLCPQKNIVKDQTPDTCLIMIALSTKKFDVTSKTTGVTPYPKDDPAVFAYGEYISGKTENLTGEPTDQSVLNGYEPFKIRLNYKSDVPPTGSFYILIVASACRYGDYFTGSTNSEMFVDEFKLVYDYDINAFSQTSIKDLTPN